MKFLIGLGNPGKEYELTRHNAGFAVVDALAMEYGSAFSEKPKFQAAIAEADIDGVRVMLVKPLTYMNLSGEAAKAILSYYKGEPADVLLIHDEMDIPAGDFKFSQGGGHAGHNGVESVYTDVGSNLARLRVGIGRPTPPMTSEAWVLGRMDEATVTTIDDAAEAAADWVANGTEKAMNRWNQAA